MVCLHRIEPSKSVFYVCSNMEEGGFLEWKECGQERVGGGSRRPLLPGPG